MPNYSYTARDRVGKVATGTIFAENDAELRDVLRSNDLYLTKYRKSADSTTTQQQSIFRPRKVKLGDMVIMSRQFATLIRAGLPVVESLGTLVFQTENPILADALSDVRVSVLSGETLSDAMRKHPKVFNDLYISLVDAGEVGGVLDQTLEVAATQFDKEANLREQVKAAMTYPKLVVLASIGVVTFMLTFIVPVFAGVYDQFHATLPAITQLLVTMSFVVRKFWWLVIAAVFAVMYLFKRYRETPKGRQLIDSLTLQVPVLGKVLRKIAIARFTQTFAGATKGGIPIVRALSVSANTCGNVIIRDAVLGVAQQVQEGTPLSVPLDQSGEFPPMVTRMIAAGEKSGNLDEMLDEVSKFYQRDVDYSVQKMTKLIEPLMTILVGVIVLFVLLALYMPIFNLSNVIKK
jgi:type IV pilus assembly protein PilC